MKSLVTLSIFFLVISGTVGQGLYNYGALIIIQSNALLKIDGDASGNYFNNNFVFDGRIDIDGVMEIEGDLINNALNDVFINNDGNGWVKLNGSGGLFQTIGGSHLTIFENLELNHSVFGAACGITDNQVNGQLKLTNGPLYLNNFRFIVNNPVASAILRNGTTETGYIVSESEIGRLQWNIGSSTGNYIYPFGTPNADYIPFEAAVSAASGSDVTVSTWHTGLDNTPYPTGVTSLNDPTGTDISISDVADRFWLPVYSGYNASFKFTYDHVGGTNDVGILDETTFLAQNWNGIGWTVPAVGINDYLNDNVNSVTGQSAPWVLINKNNPLPIELISFNAVCEGNKITLEWVTASETNNDFFTVEKSNDGSLWQTVSVVDGAGNSNSILYYTLEDTHIPHFDYYRLKQTDFDGAFSYSQIINVNCDDLLNFELVSIIQDIASNEVVLSFICFEGEQFHYRLYNITGQIVQQHSVEAVAGFNHVHINVGDIAEGLYLIALINKYKSLNQKIILK